MSKFNQLFPDKSIIGVVHFSPMLGYKGYFNQDSILESAKADLIALQDGGVDAIFFENNYDLPHKIKVGPETVANMTYLITKLLSEIKVPFGISVLWNDYRAAFSIAKTTGGQFIRIPVFVDDVKTSFGDIYASAKDVKLSRRQLQAENIMIFVDVQVKHATMHDSTKPLALSIKQAFKNSADAVIITGKWTGNAPKFDDLKIAQQAAKSKPVLVGSGADAENISQVLKYATGVIVSTSLKVGKNSSATVERNIKPFDAKIDQKLVEKFIQETKK